GATLVRGVEDVLDALAARPSAAPALPCRPPREMPAEERPAAPDALLRQDRRGSPPGAPAEPATGSLGAAPRRQAATRALHQEILDRLGPAPLAEDQLIRDLDAPPAAVAPELVALELDGRILRHPGAPPSRAVRRGGPRLASCTSGLRRRAPDARWRRRPATARGFTARTAVEGGDRDAGRDARSRAPASPTDRPPESPR